MMTQEEKWDLSKELGVAVIKHARHSGEGLPNFVYLHGLLYAFVHEMYVMGAEEDKAVAALKALNTMFRDAPKTYSVMNPDGSLTAPQRRH